MTSVRKIFASVVLLCIAFAVRGQGLEYRYEVGGMVGASCYYGDANYSSFMKNMNVMGALVGRYNINPRMAVKADFAVAGISGSTEGIENKYPGDVMEFGRVLYELGAQYEYNFWAYGEEGGYKGCKRVVPYVFAGLGCTLAFKPAVFTANIPLGLGVKCKVVSKLNVGCELSYRFSLSDRLDVANKTASHLKDPYGIKSGFLKNKDSYSFISLFVTYDLSPKYRKCNN